MWAEPRKFFFLCRTIERSCKLRMLLLTWFIGYITIHFDAGKDEAMCNLIFSKHVYWIRIGSHVLPMKQPQLLLALDKSNVNRIHCIKYLNIWGTQLHLHTQSFRHSVCVPIPTSLMKNDMTFRLNFHRGLPPTTR